MSNRLARQVRLAVDDEPADGTNAIEPRRELRPVQASDVARLDELTLEDFSLDFEHIEIPKGRPMTDAEVQQAVDHFLATLAD